MPQPSENCLQTEQLEQSHMVSITLLVLEPGNSVQSFVMFQIHLSTLATLNVHALLLGGFFRLPEQLATLL